MGRLRLMGRLMVDPFLVLDLATAGMYIFHSSSRPSNHSPLTLVEEGRAIRLHLL